MNILYTPKSNYTESLDQSKFRMTWNAYLFLAFVFPLFFAWQLYHDAPDKYITLVASLLTICMVIYMRISRKFKLVAILSGIIGFLSNQFNIFLVLNSERFIELLWIIVLALYIFYAIGIVWGVVNMIVNFAGLIVYLIITSPETMIASLESRDPNTTIDIIVNATLAILVITYLIVKITQTSQYSERRLINANNELRFQHALMIDKNKEKTVLLQEIHHRVKNNLQIISSMLRLQASTTNNEESKEHLSGAVNRISSMALIHEKMYKTKDLSEIHLKDYIESLIKEAVKSYTNKIDITVKVKSQINFLSIDSLVPLALIINELTTNAIRHGMREKKNGEISVNIMRKGINTAEIQFYDSGKWREPAQGSGFGTMLIETFVEQLNGSYECVNTDASGTLYILKLKSFG